jgi:hypothetical protein
MNVETTPQTVEDYLVRDEGFLRDKAKEMVERHAEIVATGQKLRSYAYYTAAQVICEEIRHADYVGETDLPMDYFDPNWVRPSEDEDDDSDLD